MSKIAPMIGHNARWQGAVRVADKRTEYDINSDLAVAIRDLDPARYVLVRRTHGTGEIGRAYAEVDRLSVSASVELHVNSAAAASVLPCVGPTAKGEKTEPSFRDPFIPKSTSSIKSRIQK